MLNSILTLPVTMPVLCVILASSLFSGILTALVFSYKSRISSSFALTLAVMPAAMSMVVLMINGNLGIAVAVAGSFTLVRFRSIAGTGREISAIFTVMTLGVICGMGYLGIAFVFLAVIAVLVLVLTALHFGEKKNEKQLRITIPENYDYTHLFDDIFQKYNIRASLEKVRTTNMGTLIDVTYRVILPDAVLKKEAFDELRARNGNLGISVMNDEPERDSL